MELKSSAGELVFGVRIAPVKEQRNRDSGNSDDSNDRVGGQTYLRGCKKEAQSEPVAVPPGSRKGYVVAASQYKRKGGGGGNEGKVTHRNPSHYRQ